MAARLTLLAVSLACLFVTELTLAQSMNTAPPAYQAAARTRDVPPNVLFAVALQESSTSVRGRHVPWPWTLGIAGSPYRYPTRSKACAALQRALKEVPATRIDVGLGQINVGYHGRRVDQPCDLLEPHQNLAIAATILSEHHTPGADWLVAIGLYHRPAGGEPATRYRMGVQRHLARLVGTHSTATRASSSVP